MADVSVLDFPGIDPAGKNDSTEAFRAAWQAAAGGTVRIPKGCYRIQPDHPKFRWWATRWVGDSHNNNPEHCSRILPAGPGKVLINLPGKGYIESLVIDCEDKVSTGLHVAAGHGSQLRDVRVRHAKDYGAQFIESTLTAANISAEFCAKGLLLQGCNASTFIAPSASHCKGVGIEVQGAGMDTPKPTQQSGGLTIQAAWVEMCGQDGQSPLAWFRGVEGGVYQLSYLEGSADAVWLSDNTHNATFIGSRFVNSGGNVLLRLSKARMCTFIGFSSPGGSTTSNRVLVDASNSYENEFYNLSRESRIASNPSGIVWQDGSKEWAAYERDGRLQSAGPPTIGRWEQGQVIENVAPTVGKPQGWVCTKAGSPGEWRPLAGIQ